MTPRQAVDAWLDVLNRTTRELALLAENVVVVYMPRGKGGPSVEVSGLEAVMAWAWRGPDDRYRYTATEPSPCAPTPLLPVGDEACATRYTVTSLEAVWSNQGDWTVHTAGGRIVGVLHAPDALPDDCAISL